MQISDGEWEVMRVIWQQEPRTAADVIEALAEANDWNHRTIRTMLGRLVEKGALASEPDGSRYLYRAAVSEAQCIRKRSRTFLSKVFGGDASALVAHLIEDGQLSAAERKELTDLLSNRKSGTRQRIPERGEHRHEFIR